RLESLRSRPVMADPSWIVDRRAEEVTRWVARSSDLLSVCLERAQSTVSELAAHLRGLSPQRTLDRGYAIAQLPDGTALRDPVEAPPGTPLRLTVAAGALTTTVDEPAVVSVAGR
ncbi:MAG: exodeoxyribonuclease VII large subunit, partial [Actinomycetota bacterium]|nr:exodeoxyribonuclease VII large subunit [Actinomycetota bacterium]